MVVAVAQQMNAIVAAFVFNTNHLVPTPILHAQEVVHFGGSRGV